MINKIKGLRKYTDCSMPSNEAERINKAEVSSYNQAIEDVVKLFAIPAVVQQSELLFAFCTYLEETTNIKPFIHKDRIVANFKGKL